MTQAISPRFVGIDVAKQHLDVAMLPGPIRTRVPNTAAGWRTLIRQVAGPAPVTIVLEATGRYHRGVTAALATAGRPASVVNPAWTHAFAHSDGRLAKTDPGDALVLAHYAQQKQPAPTPLPSATTAQLADLTAYRDDLVTMRTMEKNRAQALTGIVAPFIAAHIAELDARIGDVEQAITELLATDPEWTARVDQLRTVPGLSQVLAPQLAVGLPELGTLDRRQIAALGGVAPHAQESGQRRRPRPLRGGRPTIRRGLYLMALSAVRCDPAMKAHYQQLLSRGKKKLVALLACARRMLGILNAMVRDGLTWQQTGVGQGLFLPKPA